MNAVATHGVPSRWRLSPSEEKVAEMFHDERRMRSELAAVELQRDIAWVSIYVFGGAAVFTVIGMSINWVMHLIGISELFLQEAGFLMAAMCMGNMLSFGQWRIAENYITALKVIHLHHTAVDSNHETPHV